MMACANGGQLDSESGTDTRKRTKYKYHTTQGRWYLVLCCSLVVNIKLFISFFSDRRDGLRLLPEIQLPSAAVPCTLQMAGTVTGMLNARSGRKWQHANTQPTKHVCYYNVKNNCHQFSYYCIYVFTAPNYLLDPEYNTDQCTCIILKENKPPRFLLGHYSHTRRVPIPFIINTINSCVSVDTQK